MHYQLLHIGTLCWWYLIGTLVLYNLPGNRLDLEVIFQDNFESLPTLAPGFLLEKPSWLVLLCLPHQQKFSLAGVWSLRGNCFSLEFPLDRTAAKPAANSYMNSRRSVVHLGRCTFKWYEPLLLGSATSHFWDNVAQHIVQQTFKKIQENEDEWSTQKVTFRFHTFSL